MQCVKIPRKHLVMMPLLSPYRRKLQKGIVQIWIVLFLHVYFAQCQVHGPHKNPCTCGKLTSVEQANQGNFPWTAAIVGKYDAHNEPICWGSLINDLYILSAAHCTSQFRSVDIEVILNFHESKENPRRSVAKIKNHPGFMVGKYSYDNDISLLKLREPVIFHPLESLFPVCLPPKGPAPYASDQIKANFSQWCANCDIEENPEERILVMSRFTGYELVKGFPYWVKAHTFEKMLIFTLKTNICSTLYPNRIKAQFLCGEVRNQTDRLPFIRSADLKTFCHDDPGSGLIQLRRMKRGCDPDYYTTKEAKKVRFVQVGISSDQKDCVLHSDRPVLLFTRIRRYVSWIMENTYDAIYCENSPL